MMGFSWPHSVATQPKMLHLDIMNTPMLGKIFFCFLFVWCFHYWPPALLRRLWECLTTQCCLMIRVFCVNCATTEVFGCTIPEARCWNISSLFVDLFSPQTLKTGNLWVFFFGGGGFQGSFNAFLVCSVQFSMFSLFFCLPSDFLFLCVLLVGVALLGSCTCVCPHWLIASLCVFRFALIACHTGVVCVSRPDHRVCRSAVCQIWLWRCPREAHWVWSGGLSWLCHAIGTNIYFMK